MSLRRDIGEAPYLDRARRAGRTDKPDVTAAGAAGHLSAASDEMLDVFILIGPFQG